MSDRVLRGTRLGSVSYESDRHTEFAPRLRTAYDCPNGHATEVPFAAEADIPSSWECKLCGAPALLRDGRWTVEAERALLATGRRDPGAAS